MNINENKFASNFKPRIALLWIDSFQKMKQGTELLGHHLNSIFPDSKIITIADSPNKFVIDFKFRWFRLDEVIRAIYIARHFLKLSKRNQYNAVISQGIMGLYLSIFRPKIPIIHLLNYCTASLIRSPAITYWKDRVVGYFWGFLERMSGWRKDCRVTICEDTRSDIRKYYRMDYDRVIPLAVDMDLFKPGNKDEERRLLNLREKNTLALFVGRLEYAKGYDVLLKTISAFPEVTFIVISPRPVKDIKEKNVITRSSLTPQEMAGYYRAADFLFHPSRFESGICYTLLEAMASNLPVIVCKDVLHNLPAEVHGDDIGLVLREYNEEGFKNSIKEFVVSPVSVKSREIIDQYYSLGLFKKRWQRLINTLIE